MCSSLHDHSHTTHTWFPNLCFQIGRLSRLIPKRTKCQSKSAHFWLETLFKELFRVGDSVSGHLRNDRLACSFHDPVLRNNVYITSDVMYDCGFLNLRLAIAVRYFIGRFESSFAKWNCRS
jgi:hypothetical protein